MATLEMIVTLVAGLTDEQCKLFVKAIADRLNMNVEQWCKLTGRSMPDPVMPDPLTAIAALANANEKPAQVPETTGEFTILASEAIATSRKDKGIWAGRQWHSAVEIVGKRAGELLVLGRVNAGYLCKKFDGTKVRGQMLLRDESQITFDASDPKVSNVPNAPTPAVDTPPAETAKRSNPANVKARVLPTVPANATHLVLVDKNGERAKFGEQDALYLRGKSARKILNGSHRMWSPRIEKGDFEIGFLPAN